MEKTWGHEKDSLIRILFNKLTGRLSPVNPDSSEGSVCDSSRSTSSCSTTPQYVNSKTKPQVSVFNTNTKYSSQELDKFVELQSVNLVRTTCARVHAINAGIKHVEK